MSSLTDDAVRGVLRAPNHAVISTLNEDGSVLSAVVWFSLEDGTVALNSAEGRRWPTNLNRDPRITLVVYPPENPYEYVEVRGRATADRRDADAHIDRLAKAYLDADEYPYRQAGEVRVKYVIEPERVRYQKQ